MEITSVYAIATRFVNVLTILSTGKKFTHTKQPQIYTHHTQTWLPVTSLTQYIDCVVNHCHNAMRVKETFQLVNQKSNKNNSSLVHSKPAQPIVKPNIFNRPPTQ